MTREEQLKIVSMRLDGASMGEIAAEMGCSRQNIHLFFCSLHKEKKKRGPKIDPEKWARPRLAQWLVDNEKGVYQIAREVGKSSQTIRVWFASGSEISYRAMRKIERISAITCIPVSELLAKEERRDNRKGA